MKFINRLLITCTLLISLTACADNLQDRKLKKQTIVVIEAIKNYEEENNRFPKELQDLIPTYLTSIPKTIPELNYCWENNLPSLYFIEDGDELNLFGKKIVLSVYKKLYYDFTTKKWDIVYFDE